jgi:hypothetical protein
MGRETLGIPHCLYNRLTDGVDVFGLTCQPVSSVQKHFSVSDSSFLLEAE